MMSWFMLSRHSDDPVGDPPVVPPVAPLDSEELNAGGKAALTAERAARKTAENNAKVLAEKVAEYEAANLSATEKLQKAAADSEKRAVAAELSAARSMAVVEHQLSAGDVEFLTGVTAAEVSAQAERLAARLRAATPPVPPVVPGAPPVTAPKDSNPPPTPDFRTATRDERATTAAALGIRLRSR